MDKSESTIRSILIIHHYQNPTEIIQVFRGWYLSWGGGMVMDDGMMVLRVGWYSCLKQVSI
jgi:hypothetical protein